MEQRNYGRHKNSIPAFIRSGYRRYRTHEASDSSRSPRSQDTKDFNRESGASKKTVTMAPTSRYMTGRILYTTRKPLISTDHQISILKNPLTHEYSERVHTNSGANCQSQDTGMDLNNLDSTSDPQITASSFSSAREDLYASLNLSELRLCSSREEPSFSSVLSESKVESKSLSSTHLDDLSLTIPLSPKWTSTQRISPQPYTSQILTSQKANTRLSIQKRHAPLNTGFSLSNNKRNSFEPKPMSHYQTTYWACAIPSTVPPSPDRKSPSWDPNKEYQTLLDYTYPLKPNMTNSWTQSEHKIQTNHPLQDSGIEMDSLLSSSRLSFLDQPVLRMRQDGPGPASNQTSVFQSPSQRKLLHSKSSDMKMSKSLNSSLDQVGLSLESMDCERKDNFHYKKFGVFSTSRSAPTFIRSTNILPHPGSFGEWDEEFLQLPEQLQEIQDLSQKVKDITAQISQPITTKWGSLQSDSVSIRSALGQLEKQAADVSCVQGPAEDIFLTEQMKRLDMKMQLTRDNLRDVETTVDQPSEMAWYEFMRKREVYERVEETQESLFQNLQTFCSNLEKLIEWLHTVVEKIDVLTPPSVNTESVKMSLADYKSFQEEVQAHRPLTASVLQTGEMLLCCMNSACPYLRDTLLLIKRQSLALEAHSDQLFSSILSTVDLLTDTISQDDPEETSFSSQDQ